MASVYQGFVIIVPFNKEPRAIGKWGIGKWRAFPSITHECKPFFFQNAVAQTGLFAMSRISSMSVALFNSPLHLNFIACCFASVGTFSRHRGKHFQKRPPVNTAMKISVLYTMSQYLFMLS
jgi:hypothetical protein